MSFDPLICSEQELNEMLNGYFDAIAARPSRSDSEPYAWGYMTAASEPAERREVIGALLARLVEP